MFWRLSYGGEGSGVRIVARGIDFISKTSRPSGAHPALLFDGYRGYFLAVKRPGSESDHSPPSSAQDKNSWSYITSLLHLSLHGKDRNFKVFSLTHLKRDSNYMNHQIRNSKPSILPTKCSFMLVNSLKKDTYLKGFRILDI